jgi:hypothetical protein|tara:strand:+ start:416 stop:916 length:501 start_codon:yes stop_codon:yes gene_type:complete
MKDLCYLPCRISLIFAICNLFFTVVIVLASLKIIPITSTPQFHKLVNLLDNEQKNRYDNIKNERKNLAMQGYLLGMILSCIIIYYCSISKNKSINKTSYFCIAISVTYITHYFYYLLMPKSDWMVIHLKTVEQRKEWINIYKIMDWLNNMGFLVGLITVLLLCGDY